MSGRGWHRRLFCSEMQLRSNSTRGRDLKRAQPCCSPSGHRARERAKCHRRFHCSGPASPVRDTAKRDERRSAGSGALRAAAEGGTSARLHLPRHARSHCRRVCPGGASRCSPLCPPGSGIRSRRCPRTTGCPWPPWRCTMAWSQRRSWPQRDPTDPAGPAAAEPRSFLSLDPSQHRPPLPPPHGRARPCPPLSAPRAATLALSTALRTVCDAPCASPVSQHSHVGTAPLSLHSYPGTSLLSLHSYPGTAPLSLHSYPALHPCPCAAILHCTPILHPVHSPRSAPALPLHQLHTSMIDTVPCSALSSSYHFTAAESSSAPSALDTQHASL